MQRTPEPTVIASQRYARDCTGSDLDQIQVAADSWRVGYYFFSCQ